MSVDPPASGSFPQAPAAPSLVGEVLDGRYKVIKKLGEGGMGEVYAAEHVHIEKRFAVKLLKAEIVSNQEAVKRFQQEARSSSSIKHKNIIGVEDFGRLPDGRIYMCMELLNGAPLNDMIQHPMGADRLLNILIQAGHGLAAAHAKGIVHRDMKPENIYVTQAGTNDVPKLLDFGIAKVAGNDGQNNLTRTGTIFGTPFYMAPEQALGNPVDARTDIYAMGVIMYECFAGSLPFQGESFMGILTQHITTPPEPVAQRAAKAGRQLPMGMAEIITKCMDKDPNQRFQTMDELVNALIGVYRGIAGPGMSTYMEAFPVGSAQHMAQPTPPPLMPGQMSGAHTPMGGMPGAKAPTVGVGAPPPYQSQPMMPSHGMPSGPSAALGSSGLYDPSGSSVAVPKKSNAGIIIALVILLAAGGAIAAFVVLGKKDDKGATANNGSDTGSQVAVNDTGSAETPDKTDTGSAEMKNNIGGTGSGDTQPDGSGAGSGDTANTGSGSGSADTGSDTTVPAVKTIPVLLVANSAVFEVYEGDKKIIDGPDSVEIIEGTPRKFTIKANGFKDKSVVVDGKQKRFTIKLTKAPKQSSGGTKQNTGGNTQSTGGNTPPPPRMDCSKTIQDPSSATCRMQYCKAHPNDQRCAVLDDE